MKVVWRLGHATVRDVYHALLENRHIAYTTVMTMMNVLETKGYDPLKGVKEAAARRWCSAVNAHCGFGHWSFEMTDKTDRVRAILDSLLSSTNSLDIQSLPPDDLA